MKEKLPRKLQKKFKKAWGPREVVMKEILKRSTMFRNSLDQEEKQKITDELNEILEKPENKKKLRKVLDAFTALQCNHSAMAWLFFDDEVKKFGAFVMHREDCLKIIAEQTNLLMDMGILKEGG
jgi:hypothetical protein